MLKAQDSDLLIHNQLLNRLPEEEYERLSPHLEHVTLSLGDVLYYPQDPVTYVYFPNSCTLSILAAFENGGVVAVGVVGNEGMFGLNVVLGSVTTVHESLVQLPGDAFRIREDAVRETFKEGGIFQDLLLRYTQALIIQTAQTAACNASHPLNGRLARWLLMSHDRANIGELEMTHEFIASMLGSRRAGVTVAAGMLQDEGLIRYRRGHIKILDRERLEKVSCECYHIVRQEFDRLLGANGHAL